MKFFKFKLTFSLIAISAIILASCSSTDNPVTTPAKPEAPTNLMATSIDESTVALKWTLSTSDNDTLFDKYLLYVDGNLAQTLPKSTNGTMVSSLTQGIHNFVIKARFTNNEISDSGATIKWAPAKRFTASFKMYEKDSDFGSGLNLYDAANEPSNQKVVNGDKWDICFDLRDSNCIGSPKGSRYTDDTYKFIAQPTLTARNLDIYHVVFNVNSLSEVYDSQGIDAYPNPRQYMVNFTSQTKGFVLFVKSYPPSSTGNFAKIFVKTDDNGNLVQGTAPNRYINCEVSYQLDQSVPYAKTTQAGSRVIK